MNSRFMVSAVVRSLQVTWDLEFTYVVL